MVTKVIGLKKLNSHTTKKHMCTIMLHKIILKVQFQHINHLPFANTLIFCMNYFSGTNASSLVRMSLNSFGLYKSYEI